MNRTILGLQICIWYYNRDYLFVFNEKMKEPRGVCIEYFVSFTTVRWEWRSTVLTWINVSDRINMSNACDYHNNRVQIFMEDPWNIDARYE